MSPSFPSTRRRAIGGLCSYALLTLVACRGGGPTRPAPGGVEPSVSSSQARAAPLNAHAAADAPDSGVAVPLDIGLQCPNRKPRVFPAAPPPNRLAAGGLDCPRGMVEVPGGWRRTQTQGWSETGTGERIAHPEVLVPQRSFCLDQTEVTRAEMKLQVPPSEVQLPAEVGFKAAAAHCNARGLRLPTQEEWSFAAVDATDLRFPWGDDWPRDGVCWLRGEESQPCPVGTSPRDVTPDGVRDLAGNVREWVRIVRPWEPHYGAVGGAHDTTCIELSLRGPVFHQPLTPDHAGFRCAANGRPRAQPAR